MTATLRAAARVARADLAGRPVQTALTALAIFAAATALVVTLAMRSGLDDPFAKAQDATRGAHVGISRASLDDAQIAALTRKPGVVASDARPEAFGTTALRGVTLDLRLQGLPRPAAPVDVPRVTDGRRPSGPAEVLLERSFARETGLRIGQTLNIDAREGGQDVALRITGLAVTTQQADFPHWDPGVAWAADAAVRQLGGTGTGTRVGVRLADPEAASAYIATIDPALSGGGVTDWHDVRDTITDQARTNTIIIGVNTLLALIAVGFTVATVISGRVLAQRREIGLLKAIGVTPGGVVALLVVEYVALALAAGLLGLVAGTLIAPLLLEPMSTLLATPTPSAFQPATLVGALALIVAAVALFAAIPALRAGRLNSVDALALGRTSLSGGASRAARVAAALRLPATARLGVKDAFTSRSRATLTVGALTLMVITLVAALSMEATYDRVIDDPALRAKPWDVRVQPGAVSEQAALQLVRAERPVERATTISGLQVTTAAGQEVQARALGEGFERFVYAVPDGRMYARPGEAIAGHGFYERFGVAIGDTVTLKAGGRPFQVTLVGRHVEPDNDGEIVIFPRATLPAGTNLGPADVIAGFAPGTDAAAVARNLRRHAVTPELVSDEVRQERADVRPIVYGSSALLVAVGLVNLLTTLLLVTRERARDFGILKAIGLTPRGVLGVVTSGGAALGLLAIVLGIPIGVVLFRALMTAMSESEGADIVGTPGPFALALIVPFVLVVTALASSLPARSAARASAAQILRAE
jgi:putative ABC transport system permease protein